MPVCRTDKAGDAIEASRRPGGPCVPAQPLMTPPAPFSSSLPQSACGLLGTYSKVCG